LTRSVEVCRFPHTQLFPDLGSMLLITRWHLGVKNVAGVPMVDALIVTR
jgi:hypothetical protein